MTLKIVCPHRFDQATQKKLIDAIESCPVLHSLHPDIQVQTTYLWQE